ncbi:MAG: hypothetical protein MUF10_09995 [Thermoanaerobaculaceae bacterium]|nr:hypothetical protein [Thermoanaerobaculaceae bacterium]
MKQRTKRPRRSRHTATEYFVAAVGLALLVFIVAILATADSCSFRINPEVGTQPARPAPTAVPTP